MPCFLHEQEGDSQTQISQPTFSEEWETESSKPKKINSGGDGCARTRTETEAHPSMWNFFGFKPDNGELFCASNALTL